ncbi:alpha/beta fold hydrolase ['Paenibacillus yunnanensis' Narsing Rao et al. 2020]|uniref:alpha/beta fold hydrolase n=1 Tax=Paenibacillus tengchongensis TaxID=2608684 RepID=UPI00124DA6FC|nr:alpha/beta hydrolase [Paenibacillus tengchongensis]
MKNYFVHNDDVILHVLEEGTSSPSVPSLVVISGLWEPAERAIPLLSGLSGHTVALSLRGRGLSSTPASGYGLEEHLSDIAAVVEHLQLEGYCMLGFSRGASYALGWTLRHRQKMKGLILVDQPPVHRSVSAEAADFWTRLVYRGVPVLNYMRPEAIQGLMREAAEVDFTRELSGLQLPVTVFAGRDHAAMISSDLPAEMAKRYREAVRDCEIIEFAGSGHMIPDDEQQKYIAEVARFLKRISV